MENIYETENDMVTYVSIDPFMMEECKILNAIGIRGVFINQTEPIYQTENEFTKPTKNRVKKNRSN